MMRGLVNANHEAIVRLRLRGPGGIEFDTDALIDTGFDDQLVRPKSMIASLGLRLRSTSAATLADGSIKQFKYFDAEVEWLGAWRSILVASIGDHGLMGMQMLAKHELRIEVAPGGAVEVKPLP